MISRISVVAILVAFLGAGCSTVPPAVDTGASAELTFDGLYPVRNTRADAAWSTADLDLSGYTKIMLRGAGIEYRPVKAATRSSSASEFPLSDTQKQRFREVVVEAFVKELEKSEKFTLVNRPGRDVLLIHGGLLDVVSAVPPERSGRGEIYLSSIGEATLVIELRDSMSDAILVPGASCSIGPDCCAPVSTSSGARRICRYRVI
jgi:hypothetical protein